MNEAFNDFEEFSILLNDGSITFNLRGDLLTMAYQTEIRGGIDSTIEITAYSGKVEIIEKIKELQENYPQGYEGYVYVNNRLASLDENQYQKSLKRMLDKVLDSYYSSKTQDILGDF
jgi:hypothetical protein